MSKLPVIAVTLSAVIFAALIPILEINDTHLTNPEWPAHARLHEAWQLLTNAALSILALTLVWKKQAIRTGLTIALIISLSFLFSWLSGSIYGGSMLHSDGTQMAIGGLNVAVIVVLGLTSLLLLSYRSANETANTPSSR